MSDLAVGNVDFVRQEESTTSTAKLSVYFSCGPGYFQLVKFRAVVHVSGSGIDKTVYSNVWTYGPFLNYVDSYQSHLFVYLTGLPEGKTFTCKASLLYCPDEESPTTDTSDMTGTWKDAGTSFNYIASTAGMPEPFNWSGTNYSRHHGYIDIGYSKRLHADSEGIYVEAPYYFNATAEQTKKAYKAVTTGGLTTDFSTRVWNDIVDRLYWIQEEWGYKEETGQQVIAGGGGAYAYDIPPVYRQQPVAGGMLVIAGSAINADAFNIVVNGIPIVKTWPWEKELGRKKIKAGDICKGSYFIALVDAINHWISIVPTPVTISDAFVHTMSGKVEQLLSVPLESGYAFNTEYEFSIFEGTAAPVSHTGMIGNLSDVADLTVENGVLPFAAQFNFFDFNTEMCKAASVDAYVMGDFAGNIEQPSHAAEILLADTLLLQSENLVPNIKESIDLVAPQGFVIGEHGYTLHTQAVFDIEYVSSTSLEHEGVFGVVNKFTITPKDNDESTLQGTIRISGTFDSMQTETASVMEYSNPLAVSDFFTMVASTGNLMDQEAQLHVSSAFDVTTSTIIPLDFTGSVDVSATVDNLRVSGTYEIPETEAVINHEMNATVRASGTKDLGDASTSVGVDASANSATDNLLGVSSDVSASVLMIDAFLNSKKDVSITASAKSGIKTKSAASVVHYQVAESDTEVSLTAEGEAVFKKPSNAEGDVTINIEAANGEIVCKPYILAESDISVVQSSDAKVNTINMTKTKMAVSTLSVRVYESAELLTVKGQKDVESDHIIPITANGTLEYTVSTYIGGYITSRVETLGSVDSQESRRFESTEVVQISSDASVSTAYASYILASELDDILVSELDEATVYDVERILTFHKEYEQLFSSSKIEVGSSGQVAISNEKADTIMLEQESEVQTEATLGITEKTKSENAAESDILTEPFGSMDSTGKTVHTSTESEKVKVTYEAGVSVTPASEINENSFND